MGAQEVKKAFLLSGRITHPNLSTIFALSYKMT